MSVTSGSRIRQDDHLERLLQATEVQEVYGVAPSPYFLWKSRLDRVLALLLLIPGLPLIGLLMLLVKLTSRGPGIYRQVRVGKNARQFNMYKIRTMRVDAESTTGPVWTQRRDPRVTVLGRVFRKLHLDEFPQLINVLRGQMSLVGPRPERPEFVCVLAKSVPGYVNRLSVLPGITGLAQINLPPDSDLESVRRKLALDLEYIERADAGLDVRMLLCTLVRVVGIPGELAMRLFGLRRDEFAAIVPGCNGDGASTAPPTPVSIATQEALAEKAGNGNGNGNGKGHRSGNGKETGQQVQPGEQSASAVESNSAEKVAPPAV